MILIREANFDEYSIRLFEDEGATRWERYKILGLKQGLACFADSLMANVTFDTIVLMEDHKSQNVES